MSEVSQLLKRASAAIAIEGGSDTYRARNLLFSALHRNDEELQAAIAAGIMKHSAGSKITVADAFEMSRGVVDEIRIRCLGEHR